MLNELYRIENEILNIIEEVCGIEIGPTDFNLCDIKTFTMDDDNDLAKITKMIMDRFDVHTEYFEMLCETAPIRLIAVGVMEKPEWEYL